MSWRPLLNGELAEDARRALDVIRRGLPRLPVGYGGAATGAAVLDVGRLGQALFWGYDARACSGGEGLEEGWERAAACLDEAAEELAKVPLGTTLFAGFPGTGWVGEHLDRTFAAEDLEEGDDGGGDEEEGGGDEEEGGGDEEEDDPNREVDEAVLELLRASAPARRRFNLFGGWVGHGVYALERLPRPPAVEILERVVELLAGSAEESAAGMTWRTPPWLLSDGERRRFPHGCHPWGLGHGIPGVLVLLGVIMLVTPGQGLLTLLIGLLLLNFPGKYRLERWLVLRPGVLRGLNWLRRRHGEPPFEAPE